jgi:hypothetical protein
MLYATRCLSWRCVASTRRPTMTHSTFSFNTIEHDSNYVFGDRLSFDEALPHSESPALKFQVRATEGRARAAQMQLPHFLCETPMFMPVGTQGDCSSPGIRAVQTELHFVPVGNGQHKIVRCVQELSKGLQLSSWSVRRLTSSSETHTTWETGREQIPWNNLVACINSPAGNEQC